MFKRKSLIFFTVVVAMVALFATTDVLAQCEDPECFAAGNCQINIVRGINGEFPIVVDSSNQSDYPVYASACLDPENGPIGFPCTVFAYQFPESCTYSQLAQALPNPEVYCPNDQFDIIYKNIPSTWQPAENGDTDTKWYQGDGSTRVLESQPNSTSFFLITTNNVSGHPAPILVKEGKKLYYGTLLAPNCWVPPPPVEVSGVSTSTPEGCTLTVNQTASGPDYEALCPDSSGNLEPVPVSVYDTAEVLLGTPVSCPPTEPDEVTFGGNCYKLQAFKSISEQAYGRVGEHSGVWYYWNGSWYYYNY